MILMELGVKIFLKDIDLNSNVEKLGFLTFNCVLLALVSWRKKVTDKLFFKYEPSFIVSFLSFQFIHHVECKCLVLARSTGSQSCV